MAPFIYENIINTIRSKSKDASKSRTYLTHLSPGYVVSLNDKSKDGKVGNLEKPKQLMGLFRRQMQKQEAVKHDLLGQLDKLIRYISKIRGHCYVCKTVKKGGIGQTAVKLFYCDENGKEPPIEIHDINSKWKLT